MILTKNRKNYVCIRYNKNRYLYGILCDRFTLIEVYESQVLYNSNYINS